MISVRADLNIAHNKARYEIKADGTKIYVNSSDTAFLEAGKYASFSSLIAFDRILKRQKLHLEWHVGQKRILNIGQGLPKLKLRWLWRLIRHRLK